MIGKLLQAIIKNRISCRQALLHKWMQVCDWFKGKKILLNVQIKTQKRIQDPGRQSIIKVFCKNVTVLAKKLIIDPSKCTKYAFALSNVVNLKLR